MTPDAVIRAWRIDTVGWKTRGAGCVGRQVVIGGGMIDFCDEK